MRTLIVASCLSALLLVAHPEEAEAGAQGVGLGVAAGLDYSRFDNFRSGERDSGTSLGWGFFVDIPLLQTFYIAPAAMLYTMDFGGGTASVTDIDMNFKFIVPIGGLSLGAGVTAGLTTGLGEYRGHYGALGYLGMNLVSNLDLFAMAQFKRFDYMGTEVEKVHVFGGGMFRF